MKRYLTKALVIVIILLSIFINFKDFFIKKEVHIDSNLTGYDLSQLKGRDFYGKDIDEEDIFDKDKLNVLVLWDSHNIHSHFILRDFDEYTQKNYPEKIKVSGVLTDDNVYMAKKFVFETTNHYYDDDSFKYNVYNFMPDDEFKKEIVKNFYGVPAIIVVGENKNIISDTIVINDSNSTEHIDKFDEIMKKYKGVN